MLLTRNTCQAGRRRLGRAAAIMTRRFPPSSGFLSAETRAAARQNSFGLALTITRLFHADCHDWHGLCRARVRRLLCRFRPPGHLRRQGWRQDRGACAGAKSRFSSPASTRWSPPMCRAGRLDFTTELAAPVAEADAVFIAVGTPSRRGDGHADLSYVYGAAREIAAALARLHRGRHQIDRAGRHRRRGRAPDPRNQPFRRCRGRVQSGIFARGRRDPRLQVSRPHRGRHRRTNAHAKCSAISTGRCRSIRRR